ncbi:MAG: glycosyltransferase, partial [Muribaculaceae bacterium]|nr:glycosyltransferase [Muribaculaceae bacterium]
MSNILIITVLYNQRIQQTNVFKTLLKGYGNVFIYDNSPSPENITSLPAGWHYISDPTNPGLSKAYNCGAKYAIEHGFDWILITDQDTEFPDDALHGYEAAIKMNPDIGMFIPQVRATEQLYLSPVKLRHYMPRLSKSVPAGKIRIKDYAIINSGTLINVSKFMECGGYNEKVFLDFADFQFMERFGNLNREAYVIPVICKQDFSDITQSKEQKLNRFKLACASIRGYRTSNKLT